MIACQLAKRLPDTGAPELKFYEMAKLAGYRKTFCVSGREELGRPKEAAEENKNSFRNRIEGRK